MGGIEVVTWNTFAQQVHPPTSQPTWFSIENIGCPLGESDEDLEARFVISILDISTNPGTVVDTKNKEFTFEWTD